MYELIFSQLAISQLKKLEKKNRERAISALERCRVRPYTFVKKVVGSKYFRLRVGNYRVILDIRNQELTILILEVDHRKRIYKK